MFGFSRFYASKVVNGLYAHGSAMAGLQGPDEITSRDVGLRLAFRSNDTPFRVAR
jgi:hypothetical protein